MEALIDVPYHTVIGEPEHAAEEQGSDTCTICQSLEAETEEKVTRQSWWQRQQERFPVEYTTTPMKNNGQASGGAVIVFRDISQRMNEEERQIRSQAARLAINALLETSLVSLDMERQIEVALDILMTVHWLKNQHKGVLFLLDEQSRELVLSGSRNMHASLFDTCSRVPLGHCLCGRTAQSGEIIFCRDLNDNHEIHYDGMLPHGHYCVPLHTKERQVMGVLCLYLHSGHKRNEEEEAFLSTYANTLVVVLERRRMEAELQEARERLQRQAHHDALTGLPNRLLFQEMLGLNIARAKREEKALALMFIDLDRFKAETCC